jgi:hypothetical protein
MMKERMEQTGKRNGRDSLYEVTLATVMQNCNSRLQFILY